MTLVELSGNFLLASFFIYLIATFLFAGTIRVSKKETSRGRLATIAITLTIVGFICQIVYFVTRWIAAGHAPVSNLFEFTTFFGMMLVFAFIVTYFMYRLTIVGLFALPVALLVVAYASMFPKDVNPLVPSLQSVWLPIHVSVAALGEAILAISFVTGLIYLIKNINQSVRNRSTVALETVLFSLVCVVGFIVATTGGAITGYEAKYEWETKEAVVEEAVYHLPALVLPHKAEKTTEVGVTFTPEMPAIINAKKLNTVLWSILVGTVLYIVLRFALRKRLGAYLQRFTGSVSSDLLDEIGARSVAIGFPVFTLGALIFAMIWAQVAWGRFWGWDPKEVWALITFLFYALFLHLRLSRGWHGEKSAWLAVLGFFIIMFNLIAVNLIIAGLHSYA